MIFVLAGRDGNCCFIASENDGNEECSMRINVDGNEVLFVAKLMDIA